MIETERDHIHETRDPANSRSVVENSPLNNDLFARELDYQASKSIAEGLLRQGLMTDREVRKAKGLLLAKYRPLIGELLAEAG